MASGWMVARRPPRTSPTIWGTRAARPTMTSRSSDRGTRRQAAGAEACRVRLVLDLETTSTADLRLTGAQAYAEHPETRVTVLCYAIDNGQVQTWTQMDLVPWLFKVAIVDQGALVVAHNYL